MREAVWATSWTPEESGEAREAPETGPQQDDEQRNLARRMAQLDRRLRYVEERLRMIERTRGE